LAYDDTGSNGAEVELEDVDVAPNEAKVIVTLAREEDSIDGWIDTIEGMEFDPGDTEEFPGRDVLRLAGEMILLAAGYDEAEVRGFLDTAPRNPAPMVDDDRDASDLP
jgi:hypothetical protein